MPKIDVDEVWKKLPDGTMELVTRKEVLVKYYRWERLLRRVPVLRRLVDAK